MTYPTATTAANTRIDKNASGWYVSPECFNIPATTPYQLYLDHVPDETLGTVIGASGGAWPNPTVTPWTEVSAITGATQYVVDYTNGKVTFHSSNASAAIMSQYYSLGDDIMAEHMNDIQDEIYNTQTTLGNDPQGSQTTVVDRLSAIDTSIDSKLASASGWNGDNLTDDTVRAGALMDDIKGAGWLSTQDTLTDISTHVGDASAAHAASAISVVSPLDGVTIIDAQQHVDMKGNTASTDDNPHGLTIGDLSVGDINIRPDGNIYASNIGSYNTLTGAISASGNISPVDKDEVKASGVRDVGSKAHPWASGNFDSIQSVEFLSGESAGADGIFTTSDGKTVTVKSGLIVNIV